MRYFLFDMHRSVQGKVKKAAESALENATGVTTGPRPKNQGWPVEVEGYDPEPGSYLPDEEGQHVPWEGNPLWAGNPVYRGR